MKKTQKRTGIIALVLLCLFALSIAIISLYSTGITFASAVTDGDNIYSAANTYNASVETRNEIIDGISYEYEFATYNLKARSNGAKVSNDLPQVTFITHGLSGNAGHWSNNGSTGDFCYMENSVIEFLKQKAECNVYVAQFYNGMQYNLYKLPETNYVKAQYAAYKVEKIIDNTRHSIVVFEAYSPNGTNDFIYAQFDKMASTVVSQLAELDSKHELPRVNLIGHSRGGITNMQYALDHPDLVDSIYSIATPYVGSTSADIDMYLLQGAFSGTPGESDIINHDIYMEYMDRWNEGYSNNLYSDIKVHAIGGYESLDTLVYSLLVNYINSHDLDVLLRVGLKAANVALSTYLVTHPVGEITVAIAHELAGIYLDALLSQITTRAKINYLSGITAAMELLLCEIQYNPLALSYDVLNDGLVDLPSQLGYERETGKHYDGFIRYTRRLNVFDNLQISNSSDPTMPKVMHNLEACDINILAYIVRNISLSNNTSNSNFLVADMGNNNVSIVGYIGEYTDSALYIPEKIYVRGLESLMTVTGIGDEAFATTTTLENQIIDNYITKSSNNSDETTREHSFTQIIIPKTVKYIGANAFRGNNQVTAIEIDEASELSEIHNGAFSLMQNLKAFKIPSNVENIGENAFYKTGIITFVGNKNFTWDAQNGLLINNNPANPNYKIAIYANPEKTEFNIPNDVKILEKNLFNGYTQLEYINLNLVESIGEGVFTNSGLKTIDGGNYLKDADMDAFYGTPWYPENNNGKILVGKVLLKVDTDEKDVIIPDGVTRIGANAFSGTDVETIILPSTIVSIGQNAFRNCKNLKWILIDANIPPVLDGDCFDDNTTIYVRVIGSVYYTQSIFFQNIEVSAKPVTITYYNEDGEYLGKQSEFYYAIFDAYLTYPGKTFLYCTDELGNKLYPNDIFNYSNDVTLIAHYDIGFFVFYCPYY